MNPVWMQRELDFSHQRRETEVRELCFRSVVCYDQTTVTLFMLYFCREKPKQVQHVQWIRESGFVHIRKEWPVKRQHVSWTGSSLWTHESTVSDLLGSGVRQRVGETVGSTRAKPHCCSDKDLPSCEAGRSGFGSEGQFGRRGEGHRAGAQFPGGSEFKWRRCASVGEPARLTISCHPPFRRATETLQLQIGFLSPPRFSHKLFQCWQFVGVKPSVCHRSAATRLLNTQLCSTISDVRIRPSDVPAAASGPSASAGPSLPQRALQPHSVLLQPRPRQITKNTISAFIKLQCTEVSWMEILHLVKKKKKKTLAAHECHSTWCLYLVYSFVLYVVYVYAYLNVKFC